MKITLEGREYELKANGRFMQKFQETFNETILVAMYKMTTTRDMLSCAKLIYCMIDEDMSFDEWLDSFESPLFVLNVMDDVYEFLTKKTSPTIESKGNNQTIKKKKI